MEKFQIAKYGMMQVTAVAYGILASGAAVKLNKPFADQGLPMPDGYHYAILFRDYGFCFLGVVIIWTVVVSYLSSPFSKWDFNESNLSLSGIALAIFLAIMGTFFAIGGMIASVYSGPVGMSP